MSAIRDTEANQQVSDKKAVLRLLEEQDARTGFVFDPTVTPEKVRALMRACGVRAEDNIFSRDIIRAKYPDEETA